MWRYTMFFLFFAIVMHCPLVSSRNVDYIRDSTSSAIFLLWKKQFIFHSSGKVWKTKQHFRHPVESGNLSTYETENVLHTLRPDGLKSFFSIGPWRTRRFFLNWPQPLFLESQNQSVLIHSSKTHCISPQSKYLFLHQETFM